MDQEASNNLAKSLPERLRTKNAGSVSHPERRSFISEVLRGPEIKKKKMEDISVPKKMKVKEYLKAIKKYDAKVPLNEEQRVALAEKADPGKSIVRDEYVEKTLKELHRGFSGALLQDRQRIRAEKKKIKRVWGMNEHSL